MENLISLWTGLTPRRRAILAAATIGMFLAVLGLARYAGAPNMALLYSGLDAKSAGQVVSALDQQHVSYQVRGDAIYVPEAKRDSLRMVLAGQGLPATGPGGYEILDSLSGFGTTSQMFDAAYWRAKEGELARTILSLPDVRTVRVHIARAPTDLFQPKQTPTASVTVVSRDGGLSASQASAIRHLVAGAVSGLKPVDVAVIDSVAGLIPARPDGAAPAQGGDARAAEIRKNVERLLNARVGPGKAVVEVAVDVVTDSEQVTQTTYDPQGRVAISSESQTRKGTAQGSGGSVTVASNLPSGAANNSSKNTSQNSETQEKVNYEVSHTQRQIVKAPGAIRKISVAVLVDGVPVTGANGKITMQPRSATELAALKELVSSAAGLDPSRGDVLTIKSMLFQPTAVQGTTAQASLLSPLAHIDLMSAIQLVVLAIVAIVLGLFVIRPLVLPALAGAGGALPLPAPGSDVDIPMMSAAGAKDFSAPGEVLTGEIDDGSGFTILGGDEPMLGDDDDLPGGRDAMTSGSGDPVARLRRLIEERQAESVEILRGWMERDEERT